MCARSSNSSGCRIAFQPIARWTHTWSWRVRFVVKSCVCLFVNLCLESIATSVVEFCAVENWNFISLQYFAFDHTSTEIWTLKTNSHHLVQFCAVNTTDHHIASDSNIIRVHQVCSCCVALRPSSIAYDIQQFSAHSFGAILMYTDGLGDQIVPSTTFWVMQVSVVFIVSHPVSLFFSIACGINTNTKPISGRSQCKWMSISHTNE